MGDRAPAWVGGEGVLEWIWTCGLWEAWVGERVAEGVTAGVSFFALVVGAGGFCSAGGGGFLVAFFVETGDELLDDGYTEEGGEI